MIFKPLEIWVLKKWLFSLWLSFDGKILDTLGLFWHLSRGIIKTEGLLILFLTIQISNTLIFCFAHDGKWCLHFYPDPQASPSYFLSLSCWGGTLKEQLSRHLAAEVNPPWDATWKTASRKNSPCLPCVDCLILLFNLVQSLYLPPSNITTCWDYRYIFVSSDQYPTFRLLLVSLIILGVSISWSFLVFSISSFPCLTPFK